MPETSLVDLIRRRVSGATTNRSLIAGIGDDCAIFRPTAGEDLVFTSDFVLEGRHFTLDTHKPADIGHKALARSLSDLAAMGSAPEFCLVSLAVPIHLGAKWIDAFYRGLLKLAASSGIAVAGGDLASFDKVIADVMCCGSVPRGAALRRKGARVGDTIYVTGVLGASANGFQRRSGANWRRHLRPEPRLEAGLLLRELKVHSCMDLSDGLSLDLHRLCLESRVSAELTGDLPLATGASQEEALHGGEDYELLFTAASRTSVPLLLNDVAVTPIGKIKKGRPGTMRFAGSALKPSGFQHFP
jgi:thiamine-monophosphate kinase